MVDKSTAPDLQCQTHAPLPVRDRSGRVHCYNCLIETYQTQAQNLALRMLGDWAHAEDAAQEAFVSGYRAFGTFRGENPRAWLLRIVANTCRDMLRSAKSRPVVSLDISPLDREGGENPTLDPPSPQESPEDYTIRRELAGVIQEGLLSLPREQRLAVVLVDVQGFDYDEAARVMDCALGTVKSRLARGRAQMREFLQQHRELLPHLVRHGS